ncbi:efflux transporter outer membrane subunit [Sphingomonas sp. GlSt437]|uniref:efflux transporter outer membrane subunit n=1 Tax=Sphingomonas sp. GlSt437 TaxID=3389970 RepID=UPI003A842904
MATRFGSGAQLALIALLATTGCVTIPKLGSAPKAAPSLEATQTLAAAAGQSDNAAPAAWPEDAWWHRYGDPQLDALENEAIAGSPTFASALARIRRADAVAEQSGSALVPEAAADGSLAEAKQSYNNGIPKLFVPKGFHNNSRVALSLNWDADLWGRNRDLLAAATSEAKATEADAAQARLALTTSIASTYAELARLFTDRDAAIDAAKVRRGTFELLQARRAQGLETEGTVNQQLATSRSAQSDVVAIDENIASTRARLAALLGAGPDRGLAITRPTMALGAAQALPADAGLDLIARRPDVAARLWRLEAAARRVHAARKDFYPNVTLSGLGGLQSLDIKDLTVGGSEIASLGLAVHLPIFTAGRLQGTYRAQRADYDAAVADYDGTLVSAFQDLATTLATHRTLIARTAQIEGALQASERAYDVAKARYDQQLASYLTVLSAEDQVIATRRALNALNARSLTVDIDLIRVLGGGYHPGDMPKPGTTSP